MGFIGAKKLDCFVLLNTDNNNFYFFIFATLNPTLEQ